MNIEDLVPLTNGLSVPCGVHTLVCDRARLTAVKGNGVDMKFLIAGTDYVPRVRLTREQIERATSADVARIVRHVAQRALGTCPQVV